MSNRLLALIFVAPLLFYAFRILRQEFKDPLLAFHDSFRVEAMTSSLSQAHGAKELQGLSLPGEIETFDYLKTGDFASKQFNQETFTQLNLQTFTQRKSSALLNPFSWEDRRLLGQVIPWNLENKLVGLGLLVFALSGFIALNLGLTFLAIVASYFYMNLLFQRHLKAAVKKSQTLEEEFPAIVELIAVLIVAGESPSRALERIGQRTESQLSIHIRKAVETIRAGRTLSHALERLAFDSQSLAIRRFCDALIIALERGTPLSDVLHRQVEDIRAQNQAELIKSAGKAEIALMIPVVFLILPISILFALWPSYLALGQNLM